jgi:hypothetical protein
VSLSILNKIFLLSLLGLPANVVLFSQPSFVEGYQTTPCAECDSPIVTKQGDRIPERCDRASCFKFDRFPMMCAALSIRHGGIKTINHKNMLSVVLDETRSLRRVLTTDFDSFWIPRRAGDRKRFNTERMKRSRRSRTLRPPIWRGEERPGDAVSAPIHSYFPAAGFAEYLTNVLAYPAQTVDALRAKGHLPWLFAPSDRRRNNLGALSQPEHPYIAASPSRRTKTGGGLSEQRVLDGLQKMRTGFHVKAALVEIVYQRRSTRDVAREFNLPQKTLYQYATRLRRRIGCNEIGGRIGGQLQAA